MKVDFTWFFSWFFAWRLSPVAVIDQALVDLLSPALRKATMRWLSSNKSETGSFRWTCDQLDLERSEAFDALRLCPKFIEGTSGNPARSW